MGLLGVWRGFGSFRRVDLVSAAWGIEVIVGIAVVAGVVVQVARIAG